MKIELKELAGYLPYGLKMKVDDVQFYRYEIMTLCDKTGLSNIGISDGIDEPQDFKPILHPLSDLIKEIEHNGERFVPILRIFGGDDYKKYNCKIDIVERPILGKRIDISIEGLKGPCISFSLKNILGNQLAYESWQQLHEWHFDLHNWIEQGLAIDINTLNHA